MDARTLSCKKAAFEPDCACNTAVDVSFGSEAARVGRAHSKSQLWNKCQPR